MRGISQEDRKGAGGRGEGEGCQIPTGFAGIISKTGTSFTEQSQVKQSLLTKSLSARLPGLRI